ncbi:CLUMA_CG015864, isoform A [Clunio marinus]|uniref:CLUMA_CG015864, isoform A n=1 Tax=Clunio marinus TaxID=568069 RepID=A0A1J1IQN6_9DIPT|nr:CLUMA_CG015864, isoform A [Clunio marinus]
MNQKCILRNLKIGEARNLPDIIIAGSEKKTIGRSMETMIESSFVSREHLVIKPKFDDSIVLIRFVGKSPATLNGFVMNPDEAYEAVEGDMINLVFNSDFQYEVTFPSSTSNGSTKRPSQEELLKSNNKQVKSEKDSWDSIENGKCIIFTSKLADGRSKIAAYDMDNTIIKTISGNVFPKNIDDWQLNYNNITKKLKSLHDNGFKIVIFTNQRGIETGQTTVDDMKRKLALIQQRLEVPCQFFMATGSTIFRKPRIGMWEALETSFNDGIKIDRSQSFYVGDAAGRPEVKITKRKKDHSCADRLFAINIGLSFYTPEEHFLNAKDTPKHWNRPQFNPTLVTNENGNLIEPANTKHTSDELEIILLVGFPGSGKSFFCREYLKKAGYEIINRDTLNTAQKCIAAIESSIKLKKSCVIDNTNPDPISRKRFIDEARKHGIPIRCFILNVTYDQAKHNNIFRALTGSDHQKINEMVFNIYKKKYVEPNIKEGFADILKVNFIPKFKDIEQEKLYKMYLVEK